MSNANLEYALNYIKQGVAVLPLHFVTDNKTCSCGADEGQCKPGKHPYARLVPRGLKDASSDPEKVRQWFSNSGLNIGIVTGAVSGFFAVDFDNRDGGGDTLKNWEREFGPMPRTMKQRTSDGVHLLFKIPAGIVVKNSQKKLGPGVDVRGENGYICAAPSIHQSGHQYCWDGDVPFSQSLIADAPDWLTSKIKLSAGGRDIRASSVDLGAKDEFVMPLKVNDGEGRESTILRYAGKLRASGLDQNTIDQACLDYNQCHISPPLDENTVLDRAHRYEHEAVVSAVTQNGQSWPDPQPIKDTLPSVPPFPRGMLPGLVGEHVQDVADRLCCPIEYPAVGALVALASAVGSRLHCKPYTHDTWVVPGGAWGILIGRPSQLKSPPLTEMLRPLRSLDSAAANTFAQEEAQFKIDKAIYDHQVKAAVRKGNRTPGITIPAEPKRIQYVVNDTTYEKMIEIAGANPDGVLMFRDELSGWLHSLNKENQKEARGLFLTGWSGTEGYNTDRIGRGHVRADIVNISVLGTIQPGVVKSLVSGALAGGEGDDGLVQRFQFAVYPDAVPKFVKKNRPPNSQALEFYADLIKQLVSLDPAAVGAKFTLDGKAYLNFDEAAQRLFDEWRQALEERLRDPDSDETLTMLAHLGKYRSLFPKIALVLHLANGGVGPIREPSAKLAKAWTILLEAHARRMYHTATNRTVQAASALARKLKAARLTDGFTRSDIMLKEWAGLRTADEVRTALTVLEELSWVAMVEDRSKGGRPAQRYYINPKVMQIGKVAA